MKNFFAKLLSATVVLGLSPCVALAAGETQFNSVIVRNNQTIGGTLGVSGASSLSTLGTSGLATLNSGLVTNSASIGGSLAVGTTSSANSKAILDLTSTTKGFLLPRMTTTERDNISSPPSGLVIYNTTTSALNYYDGSSWSAVGDAGISLGSGTSGGVPYYSDSTTLASSAALTQNALVLGGGAGGAPSTLGSLGTTSTVLHGNASGAPTFGPVVTADISDGNITNAKIANMAQSTIKGRAAGAGTGVPTDLTATQATAILDAMVGDSGSGGTKGLVGAPAAGDAAAGKFWKADGTWSVPAGSGGGGGFTNFVSNPSAATNTTGWTASSATLTRDTDTADQFSGVASFAVTSATHTATVRTDDITLTKPYADGGNCEIYAYYKGDASNWQLELRSSSGTTVLSSRALENSTNWTKSRPVNFPCTDSARVYFTSTASSPANFNFAGVQWGPATNIGTVNSSYLYGTIGWQAQASCQWSASSAGSGSFADFAADTDCNNPTVTGGVSAPGTKVPHVVLTNRPAGTYRFIKKGSFGPNSLSTAWRITDGTNSVAAGALNGAVGNTMIGQITYTAPGSDTIKLQCASTGSAGSCLWDASSTGNDSMIEVWYTPNQPQQAIHVENVNYDWTAYTPTFTGFGTASSVSCKHKRDGADLLLDCKFTTGTATATEARVSLPNSLVPNSTHLPSIRKVGTWAYDTNAAFFGTVLAEPSNSYVTFGIQIGSVGQSGLTKTNGDNVGSSRTVSLDARIPIQSWTENQGATIVGMVSSASTAAKRLDSASFSCGASSSVSNTYGWNITLGNRSSGCAITFPSGYYVIRPHCWIELDRNTSAGLHTSMDTAGGSKDSMTMFCRDAADTTFTTCSGDLFCTGMR
jgi:hypothetical protein